MKTKLNLYCTLLVFAVILAFVLETYFNFGDYAQGFLDGFREGRGDAQAMWDGTAPTDPHPFLSTLVELVQGVSAIVYLVLFVLFFYTLDNVIKQIKQGGIFDPYVAKQVKFLGYMMILWFVVQSMFELCAPNKTWNQIDFFTSLLYFGCGLLIMSDVLQKARELKEEQELTI